MYAGQVVETALGRFRRFLIIRAIPIPLHLLEALPERSVGQERLQTIPGGGAGSVRSADRLSAQSALQICYRLLPGARLRCLRLWLMAVRPVVITRWTNKDNRREKENPSHECRTDPHRAAT